jgi:glycine/D-amino acid oxidase-like deaminating enzyme
MNTQALREMSASQSPQSATYSEQPQSPDRGNSELPTLWRARLQYADISVSEFMSTFDVIVLGVGGVGSAALYHAARRGLRCLGIDRFPPGHDRGSSHGESRVIRMAYFEHADYVPLLRRAYELWADVERATNQTLFHRVGLLEVGPPDGVVVPGVLKAAREHRLRVESLTRADLTVRFPGFQLPENCSAVFEADAGYLLVENCVRAHANLAQQRGA